MTNGFHRKRLARVPVDKSKVELPEEILDSLIQPEQAYIFFLTLTESNKKYYIDWINEQKALIQKLPE